MNQINQAARNGTFKAELASQLCNGTSNAHPWGMTAAEAGSVCNKALPKVAILLCTYHGQNYLTEQLDSIEAQTHANWEIWASDDGSLDNTHAILDAYQKKWSMDRISIHFGPAEGFAANFLSLACKASIHADYYAFSDQDDIWEADKLERAVRWLETVPPNTPALCCSRTRLVDAANNEIGLSPLFFKPPSFANALMQNIGGGNTMVFNNEARALLREAGECLPVVTHDWWAYLVVTGCGGKVFYDSKPTLRYRQHESNVVGMSTSWAARIKRIYMMMDGRFRKWNDGNIAGLNILKNRLTPESRDILDRFVQARKMSLVPRIIQFKRSGVYRQTVLGNIGLIVAVILGKI